MPHSDKEVSILRRLKSHPVAIFIIAVAALGVFGAGLKYLDEEAQRQKVLKPKDRSALSRVNPFLAMPSPTPTPQLSREYIYAGSKLLAVEDANASAVPPADLAVWRPSNGTWYVMGGTGSTQVTEGWGLTGDDPVEGDYDGDGKTDFSVFRPTDSKWYIRYSSDNTSSDQTWGQSGDLAAQADYDGDGKTDRAIFRQDDPSSGLAKWHILKSSDSSTLSQQYGLTGDKPAPADYDGDGLADLAVWRPSTETFYVTYSSTNTTASVAFDPGNTLTLASALPVGSDYDGDGKADYAVYDSGSANWYIRSSISGTVGSAITWGNANDIPVQNDYDGDGKTDIAVWRPGTLAYWHIRQSASSNSTRTEQWGISGDIPVPAYYRR